MSESGYTLVVDGVDLQFFKDLPPDEIIKLTRLRGIEIVPPLPKNDVGEKQECLF